MEEDGNVELAPARLPSDAGVVDDDSHVDGFAAPPDDEEIRQAMERFADIPITLSVQLDRKWTSIREILELKVDSIVKLNRSAGENVELLMDGVPVGSGEIVVIEDLMGLRVTDLLLPKQARREK
jgi:flagellar motor switch protein FliN/FliY